MALGPSTVLKVLIKPDIGYEIIIIVEYERRDGSLRRGKVVVHCAYFLMSGDCFG
jgi:hypothetical protein